MIRISIAGLWFTLWDIVRRYAFAACVIIYALGIIFLHAIHRFPTARADDLSQWIGAPVVTVSGRVVDFPMTQWNQTRFMLEGSAKDGSRGRVLVTTRFAADGLNPGDRVVARGWMNGLRNPSSGDPFNEKEYWGLQNIFARLNVWSTDGLVLVSPCPRWTLTYQAWNFRQRFIAFWDSALAPNEAEMMKAITLGARGILSREVKGRCIRAGVYHMVVVSGQKIAWLVAAGMALLMLIRVPRRYAIWVCSPLLIFYAAVVGGEPPVVRATVMACAVLAVLAMGRDVPRYYPLFLAAAWILWRDPAAILGASFQLSFAATACLIYLSSIRRLPEKPERLGWRWFRDAGAMSIAVTLGLWPLLLFYFHQLSIIGLFANWTLFPLSGVVLAFGLFVGTWGALWPSSVPGFVIQAASLVVRAMLYLLNTVSDWHWVAVHFTAWTPAAMAIYYSVLFGILFVVHRRQAHAHFPTSLFARRHRL